MSEAIYLAILIVLILSAMGGIALMGNVQKAATGNAILSASIGVAILITMYWYGVFSAIDVWVFIAVGTVIGLIGAYKVKMIEMPQTVALLNGLGGVASALVAVSELYSEHATVFAVITAGLALGIGVLTLTGSVVAAGKLHNVMAQKPVIWQGHSAITNICIIGMVATVLFMPVLVTTSPFMPVLGMTFFAGLFGIAFAIRIGGADMPIAISLLNSMSGIAVSMAGMAIANPLLVAIGAIVGAAGLILTQIMCRSMNSSLMKILMGQTSVSATKPDVNKDVDKIEELIQQEWERMDEMQRSELIKELKQKLKQELLQELKQELLQELRQDLLAGQSVAGASAEEASDADGASPKSLLAEAKSVIIVPGYGMAIAQAQGLVKQLADKLDAAGCDVKYAIHPVAGRMPGHMNVLLAEVDVSYDKLFELDDINPEFENCDVAIIVGANDVVNPAAKTETDTPIYGMPILDVENAKNIIVCNYDLQPGYAGVPNPLYENSKSILLLGDAKDSIGKLL